MSYFLKFSMKAEYVFYIAAFFKVPGMPHIIIWDCLGFISQSSEVFF